MQIIRNILQITPAGADLTDIYGSKTGVELSLQLGTAVKLEFELHGELSDEDTAAVLPDYPIADLDSTAYYFALDLSCANSDTPVLLNFSGVTLAADNNGKSVMSVTIPNTAVEQMVIAMNGRSSQSFFAELGGIADDGTANFAWQFRITMQSRVYLGSEGENTPVNDPDYYTALQVEAAIGRQLFFEYSTDGVSWHKNLSGGDIYMRVKHGKNGNYSPAQLIPYGPQGEKGEPGADGKDGVDGKDGADGKDLDINAAGTLENRTAYDAESAGFAYFATDTNLLYIKNSATSADWSEGFPIYEVTYQDISEVRDKADSAWMATISLDDTKENKMTAVDMSQWDLSPDETGDIDGVVLESGKYYYLDYPIQMTLGVTSVEKSFSEIIVEFEYTSGTVSFPDTLKWIGNPSFEAGKTYIISIINNIAVAGVVE